MDDMETRIVTKKKQMRMYRSLNPNKLGLSCAKLRSSWV
jgi:hypothetical protein